MKLTNLNIFPANAEEPISHIINDVPTIASNELSCKNDTAVWYNSYIRRYMNIITMQREM